MSMLIFFTKNRFYEFPREREKFRISTINTSVVSVDSKNLEYLFSVYIGQYARRVFNLLTLLSFATIRSEILFNFFTFKFW